MQTSNLSNFSASNIMKLIAILSIEEVRDQLKALLGFLRAKLPIIFTTIQKYVINYILFLARMFKRRKPQIKYEEVEEVVPTNGSSFVMDWHNFKTYGKLIIDKLTNDPDCTFVKSINRKLSTETAGKIDFSSFYTEILIPITSDISLGIDYLEINNVEIKAKYTNSDEVRLTNFMNDRTFATVVNNHVDALYTLHRTKYASDKITLISLNGDTYYTYTDIKKYNVAEFQFKANDFTIETAVLWMLLIYNKKYNWNIVKLYFEIQCIIYAHRFGIRSTYEDTNWQRHAQKLFDKLFYASPLSVKWGIFKYWDFGRNVNLMASYTYTYEHLMDRHSHSDNIEIKLLSPNQYTNEELLNNFLQFLNENSEIKNTGEDISIYELKFTKVITKESKPNPEYEQWEELTGMMKSSPNFIPQSIPMPPKKTLSEEKEDYVVKLSNINTVFKGLDTVYLPLNIKETLLRMLDNFQDKHDGLFKKLGIPSKLGICLYGEPGTGKSTTIQAIASYLGKDIYFVNLNGVTTNSQLKELFDHVIQKDCTGGIIVFEDIDCMTDIVRKRINRPSVSTNITQTLEDDTLSLSYLLNLLDGTLCAKNTIFIMTTNHIDHLDPALIRPGRVDVKIHLSNCDDHQTEVIWNTVLGSELSVRDFEHCKDMEFTPAELIYHLIEYVYRPEVSVEQIFIDLRQKLEA